MRNATAAALTLSIALATAPSGAAAGPSTDGALGAADTDAAVARVIGRDRGPTGARRHLAMALETSALLGVGTAWYWRRDDDGRWGGANVVDWQLGFRGSSLVKKLGMSREGWRFDGNSFGLNAVGHPMFGAMTYFEARRHRYGTAGAFVVSTAASGAWEMVTEWAEYGSINDALATSTTGVPLGEAGYQLYRGWRQARYTVTAGAGTEGGAGFGVLEGRVALDTVPTRGAGTVVGGRRVSLDAELQADSAVRGVEGMARSTLVGTYRGGAGRQLFAGIDAAFTYRDRKDRSERAWDLLSTVGVGPTAQVSLATGGLHLHAGVDAHLAFGMVKAEAYDAWRADHPEAVVRNSMQDRARPYYYARAFTARPRIAVRYRGLELGATVAGYQLDSLDGADRDQELLTADPHIADTDVSTRTWLGLEHRGVTFALDRRTHARRGAMDGAHGRSGEETTILALSWAR